MFGQLSTAWQLFVLEHYTKMQGICVGYVSKSIEGDRGEVQKVACELWSGGRLRAKCVLCRLTLEIKYAQTLLDHHKTECETTSMLF